jgi:hypothetical protein
MRNNHQQRQYLATVSVIVAIAFGLATRQAAMGFPIASRLRPVNEPIPKTSPAPEKPHPTTLAAKFGQPYSLDGDGWSLNLTLDRVELNSGRYLMGGNSELPDADEKLVIVHYTLQNPNPSDVPVDGQTVSFAAFDSDKNGHSDLPEAQYEGTDNLVADVLKGKDSANFVKVIHVPAYGAVVALTVTPTPAGVDTLRFDLAGHVSKLPAPYAYPKDATGMTAAEPIPARIGVAYPLGDCDITLVKAEYTHEALLSYNGVFPPEDGDHYALFTFDITCQHSTGMNFNTQNLNPTLTTTDGDSIDPAGAPLLKADDDGAPFDTNLSYGVTARFRIYFPVAKSDSLASLTIQATETSHRFSYDLSTMTAPASDGSDGTDGSNG